MIVLGLNIFHADTSASLVIDGKLIAAVEEERFTKIKHFAGLPLNAIKYCLDTSNLTISEIDVITVNYNSRYNFFDKIFFTFRNINISIIQKFLSLSKKNNVKTILQNSLQKKINAKIVYVPHHISHIASSYFLSGFNDAVGLTVDGSGDFSTSESFLLEGNSVKTIDKTIYPHSLGVFYQTFTQFLGFKNYGDEYKVMGLSSYGTPKYKNRLKKIINYDEYGNFKLNLNYFNHHKSSLNFIFDDGKPIFSNFFNINFLELFGSERSIDQKIEVYHKDLAASVQNIFEEIIILKLKNLKKKNNKKNLVLSGGCFHNSILCGKIHDLDLFDKVFISPFVGDAGGGTGSALYFSRNHPSFTNFPLQSAYLGPNYSNEFIDAEVIKTFNLKKSETIKYEFFENFSDLCSVAAKEISENKLLAWVQGKTEFGPRALGNRSLLANPTNPKIRDIINEKIKKRESFRPFAPIIMEDYYKDYFYQKYPSPFMTFVFEAKSKAVKEIPGVIHVDGTSRVQTVNEKQNSKIYELLKKFKEQTGVPVLLNTSLNINEPINNDPITAFETFTKSNIDILIMQNYVFYKKY